MTAETLTPTVPDTSHRRLNRSADNAHIVRLRAALDRTAGKVPGPAIRDAVCSWLAGKGLWNGQPAESRFNVYDEACNHDPRALSRAADLAHLDAPGHFGPLSMCHSDLCRALSEAGAE